MRARLVGMVIGSVGLLATSSAEARGVAPIVGNKVVVGDGDLKIYTAGVLTKSFGFTGVDDVFAAPNGFIYYSIPDYDIIGFITGNGVWQGQFQTGLTPGFNHHRPKRFTWGNDGNVWFTVQGDPYVPGGRNDPGAFARINSNWTITEWVAGTIAGFTPYRQPTGIAIGADGKIWISEAGNDQAPGAIASYYWVTNSVTEYTQNITPGFSRSFTSGFGTHNTGTGVMDIARANDGHIWFTVAGVAVSGNTLSSNGTGAVGYIDGNAVVHQFFPSTDPGSGIYGCHNITRWCAGDRPFGLVAAADGNLWFTLAHQGLFGALVRMNGNGTTTHYLAPSPPSGISYPVGYAENGVGDSKIWMAQEGGRLGSIDPFTGASQFFQ